VIGLWVGRGVYDKAFVKSLKKCLNKARAASAQSSNPLIGSFSDEEYDEGDDELGAGREADYDNDDDNDDDDEGGEGRQMAPLQRQDSTASLTAIPLPRLLVVTKSKGNAAAAAFAATKSDMQQVSIGYRGGLQSDCRAKINTLLPVSRGRETWRDRDRDFKILQGFVRHQL